MFFTFNKLKDFKLQFNQPLVISVQFEQFLVISGLYDLSMIHHQYHISSLNGSQAVGNDY